MLGRGVLLRWSKDGEFFPGTVFDYNTATGKGSSHRSRALMVTQACSFLLCRQPGGLQ